MQFSWFSFFSWFSSFSLKSIRQALADLWENVGCYLGGGLCSYYKCIEQTPPTGGSLIDSMLRVTLKYIQVTLTDISSFNVCFYYAGIVRAAGKSGNHIWLHRPFWHGFYLDSLPNNHLLYWLYWKLFIWHQHQQSHQVPCKMKTSQLRVGSNNEGFFFFHHF